MRRQETTQIKINYQSLNLKRKIKFCIIDKIEFVVDFDLFMYFVIIISLN